MSAYGASSLDGRQRERSSEDMRWSAAQDLPGIDARRETDRLSPQLVALTPRHLLDRDKRTRTRGGGHPRRARVCRCSAYAGLRRIRGSCSASLVCRPEWVASWLSACQSAVYRTNGPDLIHTDNVPVDTQRRAFFRMSKDLCCSRRVATCAQHKRCGCVTQIVHSS